MKTNNEIILRLMSMKYETGYSGRDLEIYQQAMTEAINTIKTFTKTAEAKGSQEITKEQALGLCGIQDIKSVFAEKTPLTGEFIQSVVDEIPRFGDSNFTKSEQAILDSIDFSDIYGLQQSRHGHAYRFIYDGETLRQFDIALPAIGDDYSEDIGFPINSRNFGGPTHITKLESLDEVKAFLFADYETDYEDPRLIDIAEGACTIVTDNFISDLLVKQLPHIPENELTKDNAFELTKDNALLAPAKQMIQELQNADTDYEIDFNNPFYGTSKDMRFSDLTALYEAYETYKDAMQNEPELD